MAYTNFTNCTANEYKNIIYSQETKNKIKILFNNVELEDADEYCELFEVQSRVIPYGSKIFMLENLVSQEATLILHNIDTSIIQDQISISIGTLVDEENDIYEYVPIGIYNLQEIPTTDKGKTTILLRDNSVKLDFYYNAQPLIELNGGTATKLQILQDICYQAGITCNVLSFIGDSDLIGTYDSTIKGRQYVSWLAGSAGAIPIITRDGALDFKYINSLTTITIPIEIVEGFTNANNFHISKVVYESGIIKYENGTNTYDTLFLDSANPYVLNQNQVNSIYNLVNGFEINSFSTQRILGNPAIDSYDLIQITDDNVVYKCFANNVLRYTGKLLNTFDSEISFERKKENVTKNSPETFRKWAKTEIDEANAKIILQAGQIGDRTNKQTSLTQDVDGLISEVQNMQIITTENSGIGQIVLNDLASVKLAEFKVHPTNQDILGLLVSPNTIVSSTLKVRSRGITFDGPIKAHFKIPKLYFYNSDIYDDFVYDAVEERAYKIQRVSVDSLGNKSILNTPIEIDYEYKDIQLEEGNYNIYVPTCPTAYIYAKGMLKNEYTKTFATSYEVDSKITQTANEINLEVNQKVDENEVIAKINTAVRNNQGVVELKGNSVIIESDKFTLDKDGSATFKGGNIILEDGSKIMGADGIKSTMVIHSSLISTGFMGVNAIMPCGFTLVGENKQGEEIIVKDYLSFEFEMPDNFVVVNAYIIIDHAPVKWVDEVNNPSTTTIITGYSRNMKLYKTRDTIPKQMTFMEGYFYLVNDDTNFDEVVGAFGDNGFTGSSSIGTRQSSIELKDYISKGYNKFKIQSDASVIPSQAKQYSGGCFATMYITGYTNFEKTTIENTRSIIEGQRGINEEPLNTGQPSEEMEMFQNYPINIEEESDM